MNEDIFFDPNDAESISLSDLHEILIEMQEIIEREEVTKKILRGNYNTLVKIYNNRKGKKEFKEIK